MKRAVSILTRSYRMIAGFAALALIGVGLSYWLGWPQGIAVVGVLVWLDLWFDPIEAALRRPRR